MTDLDADRSRQLASVEVAVLETTGPSCGEEGRGPGGRWGPLLVCTGEWSGVRESRERRDTYLTDMLGSPPSRGG